MDLFADPTTRALTSPDTTVEQLLAFEDLATVVDDLARFPPTGAQATAPKAAMENIARFAPKLLNIALREVPAEVAAAEPHLATTFPKNATALLAYYCRESKGINEVVPIVFSTLSRKGYLHPAITVNMLGIVTGAFSDPLRENFAAERVKLALSPEVIQGAIRQVSRSTTIADLLLAVFAPGNNLSTVQMPMAVSRDAFAQHCVALGFSRQLAAYIGTAMADEEASPYFYFLTEFLGRALTAEAGPYVDDLMSDEVCGQMFSAIAESAAMEASNPGSRPLAPEGLRIIHLMLTILTTISADTVDAATPEQLTNPSTQSTRPWPTPLVKCVAILPQLIEATLTNPSTVAAPTAFRNSQHRFGELRYRIVRLATALVQMPFRGVVEVVFEKNGLMDAMVELSERYPNSDMLFSVIDVVFQRAALWGRISAGETPLAAALEAIAARVVRWAERGDLRSTSLGAHCAFYLQRLDALQANNLLRASCPFAATLADLMVEHPLVLGFDAKITGEKFQEKLNDTSLVPVVHWELANPRHVSLDVASPVTPLASLDEKITTPAVPTQTRQQADAAARARARYASFDHYDETTQTPSASADPEASRDEWHVEGWIDHKPQDLDASGGEVPSASKIVSFADAPAAEEPGIVDDESAWDTANAAFEATKTSPESAVDTSVVTRPDSAEAAGRAVPSTEQRPTSNDSADGFFASGKVAKADEEDVVYMTPPATPPDRAALEAVWRPGSRGDGDGALPMSAGSLGIGSRDDDVIPHPPNGVEGEDDDSDDGDEAVPPNPEPHADAAQLSPHQSHDA